MIAETPLAQLRARAQEFADAVGVWQDSTEDGYDSLIALACEAKVDFDALLTDLEAAPPLDSLLLKLAEHGARRQHQDALLKDGPYFDSEIVEGHTRGRMGRGFKDCAHPDCVLVRSGEAAASRPGFEKASTLSLRDVMNDFEPCDRARVEYEQLLTWLDSAPRPHRVTPPALRGDPDCVWCAGCGARWASPEGFLLAGVVHLCGDCWRKVQPILHDEPVVNVDTVAAEIERGHYSLLRMSMLQRGPTGQRIVLEELCQLVAALHGRADADQ